MGRSETIKDSTKQFGVSCFSWILLAQTLCCKPLSRLFARTLSYSTLYLCNLQLQSINCSKEVISMLCSRTMLWQQPSKRWPILLPVMGVARARESGKRSRRDRDVELECNNGVPVHTSGHRWAANPSCWPFDNLNSNNDNEQLIFIISPTCLLPII